MLPPFLPICSGKAPQSSGAGFQGWGYIQRVEVGEAQSIPLAELRIPSIVSKTLCVHWF